MTSIHDLSLKYKISVRKLNALAKAGYLNIEKSDDSGEARIFYYLRKQRPLTAEFLLLLYRQPERLAALKNRNAAYYREARKQLSALGDIQANAIPADIATALIYGMNVNDPDSLEKAKQWALSVIPAIGCSYHYLAVRLLLNVPEKRFKESYAFIGRAITNLRRYAPEIDAGRDDKTQRFKNPETFFDL